MVAFRRRAKDPTSDPAHPPDAVRPLDEAQRRRLEALLGALRRSGVETDDPRSLGSAYDAGFMGWTVRPHSSREDAQPLIDRLGAGIGQHLVDNAGLSWRAAGDALAVAGAGRPPILPAELVAERWQRGEVGWVADWLIAAKRELLGTRAVPRPEIG